MLTTKALPNATPLAALPEPSVYSRTGDLRGVPAAISQLPTDENGRRKTAEQFAGSTKVLPGGQ
jgi:hypothetical protein